MERDRALSKRLVESMDGEIGYEHHREAGGGANFWFTLPLAETTPAGDDRPAAGPAPSRANTNSDTGPA